MFEGSHLVVAIALLLMTLQGVLGLTGAILVYDRLRKQK